MIPNTADISVLIPAAGRVPEGVLALANVGSPAMIPVAGRPVIHWTLSYLRKLGLSRFHIAVPRRGMFVEDYVDSAFGGDCEVSFMSPDRDGGVGLTLWSLAREASSKSVLVVLGDTHFQFKDPAVIQWDRPFVLTHPVEESYRWCLAQTAPSGEIVRLIDKQPEAAPPREALIGVYWFPERQALVNACEECFASAEPGQRVELSAILQRVMKDSPIMRVEAGAWLDCGNPDRQAKSHQALLQKRAFNELTIDPVFGTITKRSQHVDKFLDEINYLRLLPPEIAVLFPRVLHYSLNWENPSLTMEYYGYPTLADLFIFENVDAGIWESIFLHLRDIITGGFMRFERPVPLDAVKEMYLGKTRKRLAGTRFMPEYADLLAQADELTINGRKLRNLRALWPDLERRVEELASACRGAVIHGDLCFSNILYDLRSRICKLVDARGSFGNSGIHGDPRYDVAKLFHSARGKYEFIVNDLFRIGRQGDELSLEIRSRPLHDEIERRFERVFFPRFDRADITLITGLLFASMPALHYDHPRRQVAMFLQAVLLLNEALDLAPPAGGAAA
ncbi:MAG: hypothetical protein GMKNLPBB_03120 [Myxococcota bacterium]|nr:hypothetical protein [Myxococcota bacterium]